MRRTITTLLTVVVLTIYLLIDGPRVGMGVMRLLPREERLGVRQLLTEIGHQVEHSVPRAPVTRRVPSQ